MPRFEHEFTRGMAILAGPTFRERDFLQELSAGSRHQNDFLVGDANPDGRGPPPASGIDTGITTNGELRFDFTDGRFQKFSFASVQALVPFPTGYLCFFRLSSNLSLASSSSSIIRAKVGSASLPRLYLAQTLSGKSKVVRR